MIGIQKTNRGFALPTILIASVVMLVVLISAVAAASSIRSGMDSQYYNQLASEAAESGANYAIGCVKSNGNTAPWVTAGSQLRPDLQCNGTTTSGNGLYVYQGTTARTTFTVDSVEIGSQAVTVNVTGTVELLRASDPTNVWRRYTQQLKRFVNLSSFAATTSSTGRSQVCGIIDGKVWCWGSNTSGQLGNGTTNDSNVPVQVLRQPGVLAGKIDTDVAVGDGHACSISSGDVYCWGSNTKGQLGNNSTTDSSVPIKVTLPGSASQIVATEATSCALVAGDIYCWGNNDYGELGIGVTGKRLVPTKVTVIGATASPSTPITKVATTPLSKEVCAIASSRAYCWGRNSLGQVGDNTTTNRLAPVAVYTGGVLSTKAVTDIAVGGAPSGTFTERAHVCAVAAGDAYCWGANQFGQLGTGTTTTSSQPVKVITLAAGTVSRIGVGYGTSCALANNIVSCWGLNDQGQIGDGTTVNKSTPTPVTVANPGLAGKTITDLVAGVNRGCVVASGSTFCWGRNVEGQIGDGTTVPYRASPTETTFLKQAAAPVSY